MAIKIKNVKHSTGLKCEGGCSTWRSHWERSMHESATRCLILGCTEKNDLMGGHVIETDPFASTVYIIPLCARHNAFPPEDVMELGESARSSMVFAKKLDTCGPDE